MIFLVIGEQGEYSARTLWYVRAFAEKALADALAERLNAWCAERGLTRKTFDWNDPKLEAWEDERQRVFKEKLVAHCAELGIAPNKIDWNNTERRAWEKTVKDGPSDDPSFEWDGAGGGVGYTVVEVPEGSEPDLREIA